MSKLKAAITAAKELRSQSALTVASRAPAVIIAALEAVDAELTSQADRLAALEAAKPAAKPAAKRTARRRG